MNNFDDVFDNATIPAKDEQPFDKEAWAEKKQAERQAVYDLADHSAAEVAEDGNKFKAYLDVQARFDLYSPTNALLIMAQMPTATRIKDYEGWRDSDVSIRRQQKGFRILEPGEEYTREDGSIGTSYNVKKVFDVSQTTYRDKQRPQINIDDRMLLKALINHPPVPVKVVETMSAEVGALYDHEQQAVLVCKGMPAQDIFRYVSKELAHAELALGQEAYSRGAESFKAYCVSYLLCKKNGIDVSGYNFKTLPSTIKEADTKGLRAVLSEIRDTAGTIAGRMSKVLEQGRNIKQKEQER